MGKRFELRYQQHVVIIFQKRKKKEKKEKEKEKEKEKKEQLSNKLEEEKVSLII